jgi:hypothetical protein
MAEGLNPMCETRGIANRSTGCAVFASYSRDVAEYYSKGAVIGIDIGKMKAEGYMVEVSQEDPISEKEALELLAHKIGLDDFYYEVEHGMDTDTVILYGGIPAKYLKIL